MNVIFVLLPLALALGALAVIAFVWASHSGQFDDLETPGMRMLDEDVRGPDRPPTPPPRSERPG